MVDSISKTVRLFDDLFEIVPAETIELQREAYRLRYKFLSIERREPGYEALRFPDGLETDAYDEHSVQCLVRYKPTSVWAGSARLVLPKPDASEALLPAEAASGNILRADQFRSLDRRHLAEVSRLILEEPFRRRPGKAGSSRIHSVYDPMPQTVIPERNLAHLPLIGLLAAVLHLTVSNDISDWLAAIEPRLARLLSRLGLELDPIGPTFSYHGLRRMHCGNVYHVMTALRTRNPSVWEILTDGGRRYSLPND